MSKRFKGKTCAYCGVPGSSTTGDHVLARSFVLKRYRTDLPQVPACIECNNAKSKLETRLSIVLPFGARHADAWENLTTQVPRRLGANRKLTMEIGSRLNHVWMKEPSGLFVRTATINIDAADLRDWVKLLVKGFSFHYWGIVFGNDYDVEFIAPSRPAILDALLSKKAHRRISRTTIGGGALTYEAALGVEPTCSAWRVIIYGGLTLGGDDQSIRAGQFAVLVTPKSMSKAA